MPKEMDKFKVIIAGCRDFSNYELLKKKCLDYLSNKLQNSEVIIISGHAPGADCLGERFAKESNLQLIIKPAEWEKYGRSAGPKRNEEMASIADALIAFWDGKSKGTANMIKTAKRKNLFVRVVLYDLE